MSAGTIEMIGAAVNTHLSARVGVMSSLRDRKSTRLNSSHTVIYTLSLHDALPISERNHRVDDERGHHRNDRRGREHPLVGARRRDVFLERSEEHTSELQSHRDLHSFPTRRSSDLRTESPRRR